MTVDPAALGMRVHREAYDDLPEMAGYVHDLGAAWAADQASRRVTVTDRDAGYVLERVHAAPRDVVWAFITDPALRPRWQADVEEVDELPTAPRRGAGTTNHCMHGKDVLVEEILDWRPNDHVTHRTTVPSGFKATDTFAFEDVPEGTRVRVLFTWGKNRREREAAVGAREFIADLVERGQDNLAVVLAEEMARRAALATGAPPEPEAPESKDRELREPIRG
jgi:uncharacterized protein YndB with AHSA1/START domain